eukprot:TRINITY_DN1955_c0_g1_i1.p1 TRINITY_DN1955_c0_g1~~TRINITY_DN1955_c0_g1_i1.p1  ORF type:complete len:575 (+),score=214.90 TRINITY_DN1955_c0_g1_i1:80-1804(+)
MYRPNPYANNTNAALQHAARQANPYAQAFGQPGAQLRNPASLNTVEEVEREAERAAARLQTLRSENKAAKEALELRGRKLKAQKQDYEARCASAAKEEAAVASKAAEAKDREEKLLLQELDALAGLEKIAKEGAALRQRLESASVMGAPRPAAEAPPSAPGASCWHDAVHAILSQYGLDGDAAPVDDSAVDAVPAAVAKAVEAARGKAAAHAAMVYDTTSALKARFPHLAQRLDGVASLRFLWGDIQESGRVRVARGHPDVDVLTPPSAARPLTALQRLAAHGPSPPTRRVARLLILVAGADDAAPPLRRISLLLARCTAPGAVSIVPYGAPAEEGRDEVETAKQAFKENTGADVAHVPALKFLEAVCGDVTHVYYLLDFTQQRAQFARLRGGVRREGWAVEPVLLPLGDLVFNPPGARLVEEADPLVRLAAAGLQQMQKMKTSRALHGVLGEVAAQGGVQKKKRKRDVAATGLTHALYVTESVRFEWVRPFEALEAAADPPAPPGVVRRDHLLFFLLLTAPALSAEDAWALLRSAGFRTATEVAYLTHLTSVDATVAIPEEEAPQAKVQKTAS